MVFNDWFHMLMSIWFYGMGLVFTGILLTILWSTIRNFKE